MVLQLRLIPGVLTDLQVLEIRTVIGEEFM